MNAFLFTNTSEFGNDICLGDAAEIEVLAPRHNGGQDFMGFGSG